MTEARLNIRVSSEIKEQAEAVFKELGMNMSTGINVFLNKVVKQRGIPFELSVSEDSTLELEVKELEGIARHSVSDSLDHLRNEGLPVALYDAEQKRPYLSYPDGRQEFVA